MNPYQCHREAPVRSRRDFLARAGFGFGALALGAMDAAETLDPLNPYAARQPHFPATAKSVIFIFLQGGPSQIDTFDPKPAMAKYDGQPMPDSFLKQNIELAQIKANDARLMASRRAFQRYGRSGLEISDIFPNIGAMADDLAVVRSCYHDSVIHGPAISLVHTGSIRIGAPSMGAWVVYGLGSETANLPAYMVMADGPMRSGKAVVGNGFLPAAYQATVLATEGAPLENLAPPAGWTDAEQRGLLAQVQTWNKRHLDARPEDTSLAARISNYELAYRMQSAAPELVDLRSEPEYVRKMYGMDAEPTAKFGRICLLARRMVERGVRFVHLYNSDWDGHGECDRNHRDNARKTDLPVAGLLRDLKQRGLLDSTLVVFAGEFGRTPVMQGKQGRDHNPYGFSIWMAGGGIRGGKVIGATDDLGFRAVEEPVHLHDVHATMLELLGLDHRKLHLLVSGLEKRLTGVGQEGSGSLAKRLRQA